ncbi:MAG: hypothetical protein QE271_00885 [Bacteriovoracaceae bacterium]|nr:hypothetical protein [Bacteriovoracaceae bacterium]
MSYPFPKLIIGLFLGLSNLSCSGYVIGKRANPFFMYRVESISVPTFANETPIADVGTYVGQEVVNMLAEFPDLKIVGGEDRSTDAVLIGRLVSSSSKHKVVDNSQYLSSDSVAPKNTGTRNPFLVPSANLSSMTAQFTLMSHDGKVLWYKELPYQTRYTVELYDGESANVIVTQTLENARRSYKNSAKELAKSLRSLVIDAF